LQSPTLPAIIWLGLNKRPVIVSQLETDLDYVLGHVALNKILG